MFTQLAALTFVISEFGGSDVGSTYFPGNQGSSHDLVAVECSGVAGIGRAGSVSRFQSSTGLVAVGATATAISTFAGAAALDPLSLLKLPASVFAAVSAGIAAVYEKMHPLHYVACVVLADHPDGLSKNEFEKNLREFLEKSEKASFPWYLGLTTDRLKAASEAHGDTGKGGMDDLIKGLKQKNYVDEKNQRLFYSVRSFTLGLVPD